MAEDKKVTISRTLNGNIIYYIARNSGGTIFARELTLEALQKAIKIYKEPPPVEEEGEGGSVKAIGSEAQARRGEEKPEGKKFLANKLSEKVQKRKEEQETKHLPGVPQAQHHLEGEEETKKLLENDLQTKVEERKLEEEKSQKKKSFWDKLK